MADDENRCFAAAEYSRLAGPRRGQLPALPGREERFFNASGLEPPDWFPLEDAKLHIRGSAYRTQQFKLVQRDGSVDQRQQRGGSLLKPRQATVWRPRGRVSW
ncbi:MAG: hypothetical protein KF760_11555 [Candidatus Eremiobacteraeota bacterium]|nr:hypothetical protein [Candidatus Eremiobacteraeota bacterium]